MQLKYPITARDGLHVTVIVFSRNHPGSNQMSSCDRAREYLELVNDYPAKILMVCDSLQADDERNSLHSAKEIIATGQVDLLIGTSLIEFGDWIDQTVQLFRFCAEHNTRVISFEDRLDRANDGWDDQVMHHFLSDLTC